MDAGAGYGRILPGIASRAKNVVSVEMDENMFGLLEKHARAYYNVTPVQGDYTKLDNILDGLKGQANVERPVIVSLQNSLGTTIGNMWKAVAEFRKTAEQRKGDIVLLVWNAENLNKCGFELYNQLENMVGQRDDANTHLESGLYVTKTGFLSQWSTPEMRERLKRELSGQLLGEIKTEPFTLMHFTYAGGK